MLYFIMKIFVLGMIRKANFLFFIFSSLFTLSFVFILFFYIIYESDQVHFVVCEKSKIERKIIFFLWILIMFLSFD